MWNFDKKSYGEADGIANTATLTVTNAPNGDILIGSDGGGIYVIGKDGVKNIGIHDGLSSGIVMRIKHDIEKDLFWIITSNSISYMTEDYQVTTVQKFPYSYNLDLYENSKGDMWILSSNGIYVIPSDELVANGDVRPVHYGIANGLPCITTSNSYSELTESGDLYLSGTTGLAKVNIESSLEDISDLKQAVPFIDADGVRIYPDKSGVFTIPSTVQKLFVTVWAAVLEISTGKGIAANAGHEHPALRRANEGYELQIYRHSPAVATMDGMHFREHSFQLNPGDSLFVYTDGVAEATNANNELFGSDRMIDALNVNPDAKPEEVLSNVMRGIDAFVAGAEQFDDITMLCVEYKGDDRV